MAYELRTLSIRLPTRQAEHLVEELTELGCRAVELRPGARLSEVVLYPEGEQEHRQLSKWLRSNFPEQTVTEAAVGNDWKLAWTRYLEPVALTDEITIVPLAASDASALSLTQSTMANTEGGRDRSVRNSLEGPLRPGPARRSPRGWSQGDDFTRPGSAEFEEPPSRIHNTGLDACEMKNALFLEPALAFGFGEHATTRVIARWLSRELGHTECATVLDFGCGTGILSLLAARLGAVHVTGLDIDEEAVRVARLNADRNALAAQCVFTCDPLDQVPTPRRGFDVVVANVEAGILVAASAHLVTRMSERGAIAVAGLLDEQVQWVTAEFERHGVKLQASGGEGGWSLLANR